MCQELIVQTKMLCGHKLDGPGTRLPCKDHCGNYRTNYSIGMTTKKIPCDDCIMNRTWIKNADGKWVRA